APGTRGQEIGQRLAGVDVVQRAGYAGRPVEDVMADVGMERDGDVVHEDAIRSSIDLIPELGQPLPDPNPALADEVFDGTAGPVAGPGQRLLQALGPLRLWRPGRTPVSPTCRLRARRGHLPTAERPGEGPPARRGRAVRGTPTSCRTATPCPVPRPARPLRPVLDRPATE